MTAASKSSGSASSTAKTPKEVESYLNGGNLAFLEQLYEQFTQDPASVDVQWRSYFSTLDIETSTASPFHSTGDGSAAELSPEAAGRQSAVMQMINGHRSRGHQVAKLDPLGLMHREPVSELELAHYGLSESDLNTEFDTGSYAGPSRMKLSELLDSLRDTYCDTIGVEYMHMTSLEEKRWLQKRLESQHRNRSFSTQDKTDILNRLTAAEGLERYLHTRFVGQKRFSLEGGESLIPILDELVQRGGAQGIKEIVLGMAHRGRLNVLVNVLGKSPDTLFSEFEGKYEKDMLAVEGDVKYHKGFSSDINTPGGAVHLALAFNPSHLEIVSPVAVGSVKARQVRRQDTTGSEVMSIAVHGDAAFAGQGVVMETFNMAECRGYKTGGTVHIVVNNQVGFTTSNPQDARSTPYCTDVAKMVDAPIFHVNGDDPEAVVFVTRLALDYRMTFRQDVVIDLVCYRRHGHNEADEPSLTQPVMYQVIRKLATTRTLYAERLAAEKLLSENDVQTLVNDYRSSLESGEIVVEDFLDDVQGDHAVDWRPFIGNRWDMVVDTKVPTARLKQLATNLATVPDDLALHSRASKIMSDRMKMANGERELDWGMAENLAYATILDENYPVRLSGQDSGRGTFSHRHATLHGVNAEEPYIPLEHVKPGQPNFRVINSFLSEEAVLGFEYGYATADPYTLVLWEAQFGDFANGAQVVIDQFISSGESKWGRLCGLVMLLPHGYEGQGPEHSSARLERYLQLCANHNMQVCAPTTPAQMFHLLRRQTIRPYRKPLIVMTPKSLLRHKLATNSLEEIAKGKFQVILDEIDELDVEQVKRVVVCSGKVYYDLLEERRKRELKDIALVRVEQIYPFARRSLARLLASYPNATEVIWCQEEPLNQGPWYQIRHHLRICIGDNQTLIYAGRPASASPACGYMSVHQEQQKSLVDDALSPLDENKDYITEKRNVA